MRRRDFVKQTTVALAASSCLGFNSTAPVPPIDVNDVMKLAAASIAEINQFLKTAAAETEELKKTKTSGDLTKTECAKALSIIAAVVQVVAACVIAAFTFGAGASLVALAVIAAAAILAEQTKALDQWEKDLALLGKLTPEIRAAATKLRGTIVAVRDIIDARDIFFHLSQDKKHAAKLLEAVRTRNRAAVEELLRPDAPGRSVVVQEAKEEGGVFLNVRIGNVTHCISSVAQCGGKQATFSK